MKITKTQLRQIVKEEITRANKISQLKEQRRNINRMLNEQYGEGDYYDENTDIDEDWEGIKKTVGDIGRSIKKGFTGEDTPTKDMSDEQISAMFSKAKKGATGSWINPTHPLFNRAKEFAISKGTADIKYHPATDTFKVTQWSPGAAPIPVSQNEGRKR